MDSKVVDTVKMSAKEPIRIKANVRDPKSLMKAKIGPLFLLFVRT